MQRLYRPRIGSSLPHVLAALISAVLLFVPGTANAQVLDRLGNAAKAEAEAEANRQVRSAVRTAIRCTIGDRVCQDRARREGREVILVDERGNPVDGGAGAAYWHLSFGRDDWEGSTGYVIDDEVLFALHLIDDDDVTFYLFLAEEEEGEQDAGAVVLAFERDERCHYPYEDAPPFTVRLDRTDSEWVVGSYDGFLLCEDRSAPTPARGTFRLSRPR